MSARVWAFALNPAPGVEHELELHEVGAGGDVLELRGLRSYDAELEAGQAGILITHHELSELVRFATANGFVPTARSRRARETP